MGTFPSYVFRRWKSLDHKYHVRPQTVRHRNESFQLFPNKLDEGGRDQAVPKQTITKAHSETINEPNDSTRAAVSRCDYSVCRPGWIYRVLQW